MSSQALINRCDVPWSSVLLRTTFSSGPGVNIWSVPGHFNIGMANMHSGNMANKGCKSGSKIILSAFSNGLKIQTKKNM